jgi:histidinol phosphatase-like enzyme
MIPAPLPGTGVPRRGLFVSRRGALFAPLDANELPEFDATLFARGALDRLFRVQHQQWNVYLIGNEPSVAHGQASDDAWSEFERALHAHLAGLGIKIARNYVCLDHLQGKGRHKRDSVFCFPNTGVFYHAAQNDGIQLGESWLVSDDVDELAAGWRAGCRLASVRAPENGPSELQVEPRLRCTDLASALVQVLADDEYARR